MSLVNIYENRFIGIRVSYVFAGGTSKFAFDGSGEVVRGKNGTSGAGSRPSDGSNGR